MIKKISKSTTLEQILKLKGSQEILMKYNVPCLSCPMAALEISELKLGQVAETYDLDIEGIVNDLNKLIHPVK